MLACSLRADAWMLQHAIFGARDDRVEVGCSSRRLSVLVRDDSSSALQMERLAGRARA